MTEQQHPITPPPELVQQWRNAAPPLGLNREKWIATQAARWGDEQRLEACIAWLHYNYPSVNCAALRAAMHPKPPSLAEEALAALNEIEDRYAGPSTQEILVRRALERLQELESDG